MRASLKFRAVALLPLASGAGLLGFLIARVSLWLDFALIAAIGAAVAAVVWRGANATQRADLLARVRAGALAGLLATAAYDLARYILVTAFESPLWPFEAFPAFGGLLLGPDAAYQSRLIAGTAYHIVNGMGFAIAYALVFRKPGLLTGLLWALVLELFQVTLYPTWLNLKALDEFMRISALGHVVYGLVLGWLAQRWSPRKEVLDS